MGLKDGLERGGRALAIGIGLLAMAFLIGCGNSDTHAGRPETGYGTAGDSVGFTGSAVQAAPKASGGGK
jgi:hypothetical protein